MSQSLNRRQFVQTAASAALALAPALRVSGKDAPSGRVRMGLIGCGSRGLELLNIMQGYPDVEFPVISDVIEPRMAEAAKIITEGAGVKKPDCVVEHERILERKNIDAVLIATTQHWHGLPFIQAAQAGKHIFVEKPLSLSVVEGRAMVTAAKKTGIIAMLGAQQRFYPHFKKALEIVQSGRLGKIALVDCWNQDNALKRVGKGADSEPPAGCNWDRWLGPAPLAPFNQARLNHAWWWDYSGGMLTNWAVHHMDIILAALKVDMPQTAVCNGGKFVIKDLADTPDTIDASWTFPELVVRYTYRGSSSFVPCRTGPTRMGSASMETAPR